jgi:hypothetical protein
MKMKKYLVYGRFLMGIMLFLPLLLGCANLGFTDRHFTDRNVSMKESCVLEFQGSNTISHIFGLGQEDPAGFTYFDFGTNILVIPAGEYILAYNGFYEEVKSRGADWYTYVEKHFSAYSKSFKFEAGKRYRVTRDNTTTITIIEMDGKGISSSGVLVAPRFMPVGNALGWRYRDGILLGEFGPQLGVYIASDAMVMNISGEATIGMGLFLGEYDGFGFPYRVGGSVTSFFGKSKFGLAFGGGLTGHTIKFLGQNEEMFPKIDAPYIQAKILFGQTQNYMGYGIWFDYYPTVTPVDWASFGFGLAINF